MSIHISSGQMTDVPKYNIMVNNKIPNLQIESNTISKVSNKVYSESMSVSFENNRITTNSNIGGSYDECNIIVVDGEIYIQIKTMIDLGQDISRFYFTDLERWNTPVTYVYTYNNQELTFTSASQFDTGNILLSNIPYSEYSLSDNSLTLLNNFVIFPETKTTNKLGIAFGVRGLVPDHDGTGRIYISSFKRELLNRKISGVTQDKFSKYTIKTNAGDGEYSIFLSNNELMQTNASVNGVSLPTYLENDIVSKWVNGRQTMSLTCIYGRYYSYDSSTLSKDSTEVVLNGLDGRMIEVGDIVIPTRLYTNQITNSNYELPIAVDKDGKALEFEVLSSEIEFNNGRLVTHLKLMEVK